MAQPSPTMHPSPHFERPSEAAVYWTLSHLCEEQGSRQCAISLRELAMRTRLAVNTVNRAVVRLTARGILHFRPGKNQFSPTIYELSTESRANLRPGASAVPKIDTPPAIDIKSDVSLNYLYSNDIGKVFHKNEHSNFRNPTEWFAHHLASELDDLKNLALYKSYCYRFPVGIILNAFFRAKETPAAKIKKSRGAIFNFLVKVYYDREQKNNAHSGPQTG